MDNWRQDRYSSVSKALRRIEKRADKLARRINTSSLNNKWKQDRRVFLWEDEVARLQEMTDRLTDFRDRLYFYSNLDYIEALNEWEYEIEKICTKAESFSSSPLGPKSNYHTGSLRLCEASH